MLVDDPRFLSEVVTSDETWVYDKTLRQNSDRLSGKLLLLLDRKKQECCYLLSKRCYQFALNLQALSTTSSFSQVRL